MRKHFQISLAVAACIALAACMGGLPRSLHEEISAENGRLQQASQQFDRFSAHVNSDLAAAPNLFQGVTAPQEWRSRLQVDDSKLKIAESDRRQLAELAHRNRADSRKRVQQLLGEEAGLRRAAVDDAESVEAAANNWIDFAHNPSSYLAKMNAEREALRKVDLGPIQQTVAQAEQDWPAQKPALESRLTALVAERSNAEQEWNATAKERGEAAHAKLTGAEVAMLIHEDDGLAREADAFPHETAYLRDECGQLYIAWDKILTDLDVEHQHGQKIYREQVETVRTHFTAPGAKKSDTTNDTQWTEVAEPQFHSVENDLGMAIAHKDAGKFDSEAQTTPQPAGFAYIAPPSQGSNQYGYWTHNGGQSFWTFLPQYLILRELMWGHNYRPIVLDEYHSYRTAETSGRTFYGRETPTSLPKYGTHGTFTQTRYANSRYMHSGGFRGSEYASHRNGPSGVNEPHEAHGFGGSQGRRFGGPARGRRFGGLSRGLGRGFGRRR
jgi:hypothetical protein